MKLVNAFFPSTNNQQPGMAKETHTEAVFFFFLFLLFGFFLAVVCTCAFFALISDQ